jgi:hypothetical protein
MSEAEATTALPPVDPVRMIGVVAARRMATSPWASDPVIVSPHAVLSEPPALEPGAALGEVGGATLFYVGPAELVLWRGETAHYRDNLATGAPKIWVATRREGERWSVLLATANPYEGEALADQPGVALEALLAPPDLAADLMAFVEAHHVDQPFVKRKRKRELAERAPVGGRR